MLTNRILTQIISEASKEAGMPENWINLMESRDEVNEMLALMNMLILSSPAAPMNLYVISWTIQGSRF